MSTGIFEIAVIVILASVLGFLGRFLKQPTVLAYIFTGILISALGFNIGDNETFKLFSEIGIMLLLFLIGLEINYSSLKTVGKPSIIAGMGQVFFTCLFGFILAKFMGFEIIKALYVSIALTFSSTVIIVKLLSEKKDSNSLYGQISIGMLLIQDLVAVSVLLFLDGIDSFSTNALAGVGIFVLKGIVLICLILWLGRNVLPLLFDKIARSNELLFISSLAWCFLVAYLVKIAGLSVEIGGFLAGLALANSSEHFQISSNLRSLRDFFILIFFVILGASFSFADLSILALPMIVFSIFVLIGNPLIVMSLMGFMGYKKRTGFLAGVTVAQISEFSLVMVVLGLKLGHIDQTVVSLVSGVGIVTITLSTYLIVYGDKIYKFFSPALNIFEREITTEKDLSSDTKKRIILIGFHRTGQSISKYLPKNDLLVVDFDPNIINKLKNEGFSYIFGDIADTEIFDHIDFSKADIVISTTPDVKDSLALLERLKPVRREGNLPKVIVTGVDKSDSDILYDYGADYVLLPHITSGKFLGHIISADPSFETLEDLKEHDIRFLKEGFLRS